MADAVTTNLYDGARTVTQTMTDISDGTGLALATFLNATALTPPPGSHIKCRSIRYSITNMLVTLYWAGSTNTPLFAMGQGEDFIDWSDLYSGGITNNAPAPTGNVLVTAQTIGSATATFTITAEFIKGVRSQG